MSIESAVLSEQLILCHTILFCLQSFPASGSFPMSRFFASGSQSTGASASASVLPMSIQGWFPLGWTGLISLQSKGLSRVFSNTTVQEHQLFGAQPSLCSSSHIHTWPLEKPKLWYILDFPGGLGGKASAYNAGDPGLIPGSGRSPIEGNSNPFQYPCLENPMDRGA